MRARVLVRDDAIPFASDQGALLPGESITTIQFGGKSLDQLAVFCTERSTFLPDPFGAPGLARTAEGLNIFPQPSSAMKSRGACLSRFIAHSGSFKRFPACDAWIRASVRQRA
jgi:hypothetical protein